VIYPARRPCSDGAAVLIVAQSLKRALAMIL
jgi:hypothetical protein